MGELVRGRLFELNREREEIIEAVEDRVMSGWVQKAWESSEHGLEYILNEAAYFEMSRLESSKKKRHQQQWEFWHSIALRVGRNAEDENADLLSSLVRRYATDIVGQFSPLVFRLATRVIPVGLNALFNANRPTQMFSKVRQLGDRIVVQGETERLRKLSRIGTLVYTPTHSSNMDSILLGWSLDHAGLPPVTYGAGKNLFRQPLTAFFMHNLGAYKVDRRLRHSLYKEVLKTVSQLLLERGYHSLFFPGGTRSRSGHVEQKLKLGLLGSALEAFVESAIRGTPQRIFVVPMTINYHLVLEAETLVSDFLRADGRQRYIIEDDEFSEVGRVVRFAMNVMTMDTPIAIHYGEPLDPFGNKVDEYGQSHDSQGRRVDPYGYVLGETGPAHDESRDREYTRHLGKQVGDSFIRNNVVCSIHLVSLALLYILGERHSSWDLYRTIRFGRGEFVAKDELSTTVMRLLTIARKAAAAGNVRLGANVAAGSASRLIDEAIRYFTMYHTTPLVKRRGNGIELAHLPLLFYYSNRARGYGFERELSRS
jgi:glycerol-3-phosphate O-acyltransferase